MTAQAEWFRQHASAFSGQLLFEEPLSRHTYYRIGGPAQVLAFPKSLEDLRWLALGLRESALPLVILGSGSNVLVADAGLRALVVKTNRLNPEITPVGEPGPGELRLRTGGGVAISSLLRRCAQEGWAGLEFLSGVPGSVGGAVRMNAGTHLGEVKDALCCVDAYEFDASDGAPDLRTFQGVELRLEYRKNLFLPAGAVVWQAEWKVRKDEPARVKGAIDETLARRKATQPVDLPSCGSVFKNPKTSGLHAWQVIDRLALRGYRIGDAQISEKHCNFIVNLGAARAADVLALIGLVKARAHDQLGVVLEEEVIHLN